MKGAAWAFALGLCASCSAVPRLRPASPPDAARLLERCRTRFPRGSWQVVHTIEFRLPLGNRSALLGVVTGDSRRGSFRLVALAPEGMTLLDVTSRQGDVHVRHAVPPFTRRPLVEGMVRDVRLMFFLPLGQTTAGRLSDGAAACRWRVGAGAGAGANAGTTVDVLPGAGRGEGWALRRYNRKGRLTHSVRCQGRVRSGFAARVALRAHAAVGYTLTLRLLRVTWPLGAPR